MSVTKIVDIAGFLLSIYFFNLKKKAKQYRLIDFSFKYGFK